MEPSTAISVFSLLVTVAVCVFAERSAGSSERSADAAQRSADSARRANDLAQHTQRLEIYKAVQTFHMQVLSAAVNFPEANIWPFANAANLSEFYFPHKEYMDLEAIVRQALTVKAAHSLFELHRDNHDSAQASETIKTTRVEEKQLRAMLGEADQALRAYLRVPAQP